MNNNTTTQNTTETERTNNINNIYNNSTTKTQTNGDITTPNCHHTKTENTTHSYLNTNTHNTTHHNLTTDNDNTTHSNLVTNNDNPTVTSTLIPTIPPTTTSPLMMTTQPTATLPPTPTIPPTATLTLILIIPPTATLPHRQTTTSTLPPRALTTTLPPTTTIPPSLRPTTILTPKHLPKCYKPSNTPTRPTTVSPKPNPPVIPPITTIPPIRTPNSTLSTENITHNNLTTQTDPTTVEKSTTKTTFETGRSMHIKLFTNFLTLSILLLLPFILSCLTNNVAFNVELRDCKQSFLYDKRNLYITNISHYMRLKFNVFNNSVSDTIHSLTILGIAYKLDGDIPSKNFTHKIHYMSGPEAHTIKLVFFPLLFLFMVTISNWTKKETFSYYASIKHKYLFLKSRRHFRKHGTLFVFQ